MRVQAILPCLLPRSRLMALLLAGAAIATPVTINLAPGKTPALAGAFAHARGGDDGGGDNGGGRGGDHGGRGGNDRGGDDNGGRGRGGDDGPGDDSGGRGRGRGGDGDNRGRDGALGTDDGRSREDGRRDARDTPARAERQGRDIEVTYADGWREELENGRYELKDAQNRTVVERPATRQDYDRLGALAR